MGQLPLVCLEQQLIFRHVNAALLCQYPYDLLEFLFIRRAEIDRHAKPGHERQFFLDWVIGVQLFIPVRLILDDFAAVLAEFQ